MTATTPAWSSSSDQALASAVVQVKGPSGVPGGAGFLIAPDLVLTCAHVVSDALDELRQKPVAEGTPVMVEFPLCESIDGRPSWPAIVESWVPIGADRTGDIAVLRLEKPIPGTRPLPMADPDRVHGGQVRVVGFPQDAPGGIWFEGRLSGATAEGWMQLSRASGQAAHVKRGFSGSPVWDDTLNAVVGLLVAAQPVGDAQQAYALRTRAIVREIPALGPVIRPPSPFRGLEPYEERDADVFFGREEDVDNVVTALHGARTVTVYGPSGCGKSSLALAGVVPRMRADGYEVLAFNAGEISSIKSALAIELCEGYGPARLDSADKVEKRLSDRGLLDTFHLVRGTASGDLLVILDQAEALLNRTETEIDEVVDLLFPQGQPIGGVRILVTLRSDLMDAVLRHPRLGPALLGGTTLPLAPMSPAQLEEAITKPVAQLAAVSYEPGLARRILADAGGEPGILPLLGFVLQQLWDRQDGGYMRIAAYEAMGGVTGALGQHADKAWGQVDEKDKESARRLLTKLVRMLPDSQILLRRRLTRAEVDETQWKIAQAFADQRLLVLHGGEGEPESAELAHEALITAWPEMRKQVEEDKKFLAGRAELAHDLRRWRHGARSLPDEAQLKAIDQWLGGRESDLDEEQREFLASARLLVRRKRRRSRVNRSALAMLFAVIAALATFLVDRVIVSAERADENTSRSLASSTTEMAGEDPGLAVLTAIAAYELAPTPEAHTALLRRYEQLKDAAWMLTSFEGPILDTAMSADGTVMLASSTRGRATLFVRQAGGRVLRKPLGLDGNAVFPVISRDGRRIAYVLDGTDSMFWHDVRYTAQDIVVGPPRRLPGAALRTFTLGGQDGSFSIVAFSPSADRIATVTFDGRLRVWDLTTQRLQELPKTPPALQQVWFGPDENTLVGARRNGGHSLISLDLRTGAVRELEDRRDVPAEGDMEAEVSADGSVLVVCRKPNQAGKPEYQGIRVSDGRKLARFTSEHDYLCRHPHIDQTGEHIALKETRRQWVLFDIRQGKLLRRFVGPSVAYRGKAGPLLGMPNAPIVVYRDEVSVTGWRLYADGGLGAFSPPVLLDGGRTMLVRVGEDGGEFADRLAVVETEGQEEILAEARIAPAPPDPNLLLPVNRAETLAAYVHDHNQVTVYDLPRLRKVAEFTARPSPGEDGNREPVKSFFFTDDELVTISGKVIEHWNARDGRRLSNPLDIRDLFPDGAELENVYVQRHHQPGYVQVAHDGDHTLRAVHLATRRENPDLRIQLGADAITAAVEASGRFAMVLTRGSMIELWSVEDRQRTRKILGPLGPLDPDKSQIGVLQPDDSGNPGFFIAHKQSVRFMRVADSGVVEVTSYNFAVNHSFMAATKDGKALLTNPDGYADLLRLDPGLWKSHLCGVLGRDLREDERRSLPRGLPDPLCPL